MIALYYQIKISIGFFSIDRNINLLFDKKKKKIVIELIKTHKK